MLSLKRQPFCYKGKQGGIHKLKNNYMDNIIQKLKRRHKLKHQDQFKHVALELEAKYIGIFIKQFLLSRS